MDINDSPQLNKKPEKKDFELLKPIKQNGKLLQPAAEGEDEVMVRLRKDQGARLVASGHVKDAA